MFHVILAGLLGTTAMVAAMTIIHRTGLANADMIRAVGGLVTRSYENAFLPGLVVHYSIGTFFAFLYAVFLGFLPDSDVILQIGAALFVGYFHGLVVALLLVILVAENHPVPQFQKAGLPVAAAHLIGHIVYGLTVGAVIALSGARFVH